MSAQFPSNIKSFIARRDFIDTVDAADPNALADEIVAIETTLGVTPHLSTAPSSAGSFNASATTFGSVSARLANIETGIVGDTHVHYVHLRGGDTITSSAIGVVGLTFKALALQTAHFVDLRASDNTLLAWLAVDGSVSVKALTVEGALTAGSITGTQVPLGFHISGLLTTGVKIPKYVAPVPLTIKGAYGVAGSGSGVTWQLRVNGAAIASAPTPATGTTAVHADYPDTNINAGDIVQLEVLSVGSSGSDLSVTADCVTR